MESKGFNHVFLTILPPALLSELCEANRTAASQMPALSYQYTYGVAFVLTARLVGSFH